MQKKPWFDMLAFLDLRDVNDAVAGAAVVDGEGLSPARAMVSAALTMLVRNRAEDTNAAEQATFGVTESDWGQRRPFESGFSLTGFAQRDPGGN